MYVCMYVCMYVLVTVCLTHIIFFNGSASNISNISRWYVMYVIRTYIQAYIGTQSPTCFHTAKKFDYTLT